MATGPSLSANYFQLCDNIDDDDGDDHDDDDDDDDNAAAAGFILVMAMLHMT